MLAGLVLVLSQQRVTFAHPPAEIKTVVEAYGKQVGRPMTAVGMPKDFVGDNVSAVPLARYS